MILLIGASASGKTEVAKILASKYNIKKVVTTTTRAMRVGEVNGKDYFFVSEDTFKRKIANNEFVEYVSYNNNFYGSSKDQIADDKCLIVEPHGLSKYRELNDKKIIIFHLLASEETRYNRMLCRGDSKENAIARIEKDKIEFADEKIGKCDFIIDTENLNIEQVADLVFNQYKSTY